MKRLWIGPLIVICLASGLRAQQLRATLGSSSVDMTGDWQFHTGDDMSWANPAFDDAKWETITAEMPWGAQGHPGYTGFAWYRRAIQISGPAGASPPPVSIYVPQVDDAYEIYWNGQRLGGFGSLPPHARWNQDTVSNVYALPDEARPNPKHDGDGMAGVLAIRVWKAMLASNDPLDGGGFEGTPRIGDRKTITDALALEEDTHERALLIHTVQGAILLLIGLLALGMWAFDRNRRLHLWLGAFLMGLSGRAIYAFPAWNHFATIEIDQIRLALLNTGRDLGLWMLVLALFGLDEERGWRRATAILATLYLAAVAVDLTVLPFWATGWPPIRTIDWAATALYSFLPAYLLVLLAAGLARTRDLKLLPTVLACAALETYLLITEALGQGVQFTGIRIEAIFRAAMIHLGPYSIGLQSQLEAVVLVALVWTVYREQARRRRRQVFIESEMRSAQEVQQVLVPEQTPAVPGFAISSLYWPAGEVGGDMFQVLPGNHGDVTIVLADVSGKGLKAAMTVSLMVGVVRTMAAFTRAPIEILSGMNDRLVGRSSGGFSTCLVLHLSAAGEVTMANAGHLAPYLNGEPMAMEGSLPLGISYDAAFAESRFSLREGDEVLLYTDGVLEAQRPDGELFGFERCDALMRTMPSVQIIAEAAKAFGQQDDITVVKIARAHAADTRERMSVDLRTVVSA